MDIGEQIAKMELEIGNQALLIAHLRQETASLHQMLSAVMADVVQLKEDVDLIIMGCNIKASESGTTPADMSVMDTATTPTTETPTPEPDKPELIKSQIQGKLQNWKFSRHWTTGNADDVIKRITDMPRRFREQAEQRNADPEEVEKILKSAEIHQAENDAKRLALEEAARQEREKEKNKGRGGIQI